MLVRATILSCLDSLLSFLTPTLFSTNASQRDLYLQHQMTSMPCLKPTSGSLPHLEINQTPFPAPADSGLPSLGSIPPHLLTGLPGSNHTAKSSPTSWSLHMLFPLMIKLFPLCLAQLASSLSSTDLSLVFTSSERSSKAEIIPQTPTSLS